eukprot:5226060-Pleurochrysis_carterae.AAC.4
MGWRPYAPLLVNLAHQIGHTEVAADFTVASFNDYDHIMYILTEGAPKYLVYLSSRGGMPDLNNSEIAIMRLAATNIDVKWLAHFLHDFGFLYW